MARPKKVEEKPKNFGSLQISVEDFVQSQIIPVLSKLDSDDHLASLSIVDVSRTVTIARVSSKAKKLSSETIRPVYLLLLSGLDSIYLDVWPFGYSLQLAKSDHTGEGIHTRTSMESASPNMSWRYRVRSSFGSKPPTTPLPTMKPLAIYISSTRCAEGSTGQPCPARTSSLRSSAILKKGSDQST